MSEEARPKASERAAIFMKAVLEALDQAGGSLRVREVLASVGTRVELTPFDLEVYEKSGYVRWHSLVHLYSIDFAKAGFIRKQSGSWHLTPEGRAVLALPADQLATRAREGYRSWRAAQPTLEAPDEAASVAAPDEEAGSTAQRALILETAEGDARTEIESFVRAMAPYDFQDLVAALLRGMGYTIPFVAAKGPDGGTDILAYPDPLGAKTPHIRVQVKHRSDKARREEIAALRGIIRQEREIGLFVSSAGFTSDAVREARQGAVHIELMDLEGLLDKWLTYYERMSEDDKALLRLRPVYFLTSE